MEETYYNFENDFQNVFENLNTPGLQLASVPVRSGKTFSCERYMVKILSEKNNRERKVVIFTTEKNILAESSYINILSSIESSDNLILFKKTNFEESWKKLRAALKSDNNICILCSFSYIFSERISRLVYTLKVECDKLIVLVDEAESLLNSLYSSVSICTCKSRKFNTLISGTVINALDSTKNNLKYNQEVKSSNSIQIRGSLLVNPAPKNTYDMFDFLDDSRDYTGLNLVFDTESNAKYENFTVYKTVKKLSIDINRELYPIFVIDQGKLRFNSNIFETIELVYETQNYDIFYTLIALITKTLASNSLYLKYNCVTSSQNSYLDLSYNEASSAFSRYKDAKGSDRKVNTSPYFCYNKVGRLYDTQLCFNQNLPIFRLENISYSTLLLSGTWNRWLLDLMYENEPFLLQKENIMETLTVSREDENQSICVIATSSSKTQNLAFKSDLFKLRYLVSDHNASKETGIPVSFECKANGILETTSLKDRFKNRSLILLAEKTTSWIF